MYMASNLDVVIVNPRLPKVFSVTHLPKGGGYQPHELEIDMTKVWVCGTIV